MTPLKPVQIEAIKRSNAKRGFGYFLDMGLGKTLLALEEFRSDPYVTRLLVIAPNSFKAGWRGQLEEHGFDFDAHVFESTKRAAAERWVAGAGHRRKPVLILNYEALLSPATVRLIEDFVAGKHVMLVLDESIAIKSNTAKRTKAILRLIPRFDRVRLLTGKPMTQGPHDLWAQLRAIGAENRNFYAFRNRYCRMGGWEGRQVIGAQNEDELAEIMTPHVFQARKQDWLPEITAKHYTDRFYRLGPVLGPRYFEMENEFVVWLRNNRQVSVSVVIAQYQKLLQIQCGFVHDENGAVEWLVPDADNPRLNLLKELLEEEVTGKVAICYAHRAVGEQLTRHFPNAAHIRGGMKPAAIEAEKDRFNNDAACREMLLQVDASKYGHTLLGDQSDQDSSCSTMIFYQNSYSLDTRSQIEDRIHRIGQKYDCLYVDLLGTEMDRNVIHALRRKQGIYEAVMGDLR